MGAAFKLGLTGGIGSGKSTVATILAGLGAAVMDADAISRHLTAPGGLAIEAIRQHFGADFITPEAALDRDRMRRLVYTDGVARRQLEAIIHPLVHTEIWRQAQQAEAAGCPCLVFDVPLLVESAHWRGWWTVAPKHKFRVSWRAADWRAKRCWRSLQPRPAGPNVWQWPTWCC